MTSDAELPGAPRFDVVLRGYDRRQVDEHVDRLQRVLGRMRYDVEVLRAQAAAERPRPTPRPRPGPDAAPGGPDTVGTFTDRMQSILQAAEEEAAEIRNRAHAETEGIRAQLGDLVRQRDAVLAELTRMRGQLEGLLGAPTATMQARERSAPWPPPPRQEPPPPPPPPSLWGPLPSASQQAYAHGSPYGPAYPPAPVGTGQFGVIGTGAHRPAARPPAPIGPPPGEPQPGRGHHGQPGPAQPGPVQPGDARGSSGQPAASRPGDQVLSGDPAAGHPASGPAHTAEPAERGGEQAKGAHRLPTGAYPPVPPAAAGPVPGSPAGGSVQGAGQSGAPRDGSAHGGSVQVGSVQGGPGQSGSSGGSASGGSASGDAAGGGASWRPEPAADATDLFRPAAVNRPDAGEQAGRRPGSAPEQEERTALVNLPAPPAGGLPAPGGASAAAPDSGARPRSAHPGADPSIGVRPGDATVLAHHLPVPPPPEPATLGEDRPEAVSGRGSADSSRAASSSRSG